MANPKGLKTWRRASLSHADSDGWRAATEYEYRRWLCKAHGWYTDREKCEGCGGEGTIHLGSTRLDRLEWCPTCAGVGSLPSSEPVLDLKRAERHIGEQRVRLERIAYEAIEGIKKRLNAAGLCAERYWKGVPATGFFYKPGDARRIWVGTTGPSRYQGAPKASVVLVIRPGTLAPTPAELDRMVADALAELFAEELITA